MGMVRRHLAIAAIVHVGIVMARGPAGAQTRLADESEVKAAFVYNFAKFVEWPSAKLADSPLVVGLIGGDPFQGALDRVAEHVTAGGHTLIVRRLHNLQGIHECHVLFINSSEESRLGDILQLATAANVLTVSDLDHFVERGGMIGLERQESRIRFAVNAGAASRAGLKISSQLLKLASNVIDQGLAPARTQIASTFSYTLGGTSGHPRA
jgi:hypothetical protein